MSRLTLFLAVLLVPGCARDATVYPSLAPRAAEKTGFEEPVVTPLAASPDPVLDAELARRSATLDAVEAGFGRDAAAADRLAAAARGRPVGSDGWLAAQSALATLDDWHAQASAVVTALDEQGSARAGRLLPDYAALTALRARAQALSDRQAQAIARLQAALPAG